MSIYRIAQDLPTTTKFKLVNDMILELYGLLQQGKFDINELDYLFSVLPSVRKFKRNVGLGNTTTTYTGWSHLLAESGYSIWKYTPTDYKYNANNKVYWGNKVLEYRGVASSESVSNFTSVFLYNGDSGSGFLDHTTEAGTELGTDFAVMNTTNDYLYLGSANMFGGAKIEWHTRGSNYTLKLEYWNGSAWITLDTNTDSFEDGTNNFQSDGHLTWTIPSTWAVNSVNSTSRYWIRISTTTNPITIARAYYLVPKTSVIGLLALSSTEVLNEEWAWCSYNNNIYVTIRNMGNTNYEGNLFIASSSSSANKLNYFVYNNPFTADYEDSTVSIVKTVTSQSGVTDVDGVIFIDASTSNVDLDLPSAVGRAGTTFVLKLVDKGSGRTATVSASSGETIDGAPTYSFTNDFECIHVMSNGNRWFITSKKS